MRILKRKFESGRDNSCIKHHQVCSFTKASEPVPNAQILHGKLQGLEHHILGHFVATSNDEEYREIWQGMGKIEGKMHAILECIALAGQFH